MFFTGLAVFAGVAALLAKLRRRWMLRALNHDLAIDLAVSATTLAVHWGTFQRRHGRDDRRVVDSASPRRPRSGCSASSRATRYYPGVFYVDPVA